MAETARLVAFVADQFGMDSLDAARDAGVGTRCLFMPMNLHALSLSPGVGHTLAAPGQVQPFVHGDGTPPQALP